MGSYEARLNREWERQDAARADGVHDPGNDQFGETCSEAGHVHGCPGVAGGDHELDGPDPDWFEDADGYVRAPLVNEGIL